VLRPTYAEIDLSAIRGNVRAIRERVGPHVKIMPAVKADAYGHGSIQVSRAVLDAGADILGVATVEEALELREAGILAPVLIVGCSPADAAADIVSGRITSTVCDLAFATALSEAAEEAETKALVHVKVDTGMGRIGVSSAECESFVRTLFSLPGIKVDSIFTHFPCSDEPDAGYTDLQIRSFRALTESLQSAGFDIPYRHAANSGAILAHPESYFEIVRPGITVYGLYPSPAAFRTVPLTPALTLKTQIVFLKDTAPGDTVSYGRTFTANRATKVATLPIGYADGYNRHLSNRGEAIVREQLVPVIGRVCMDQIMLDVTDVPGVSVGDEVILYGGTGAVSIEKVAGMLDTIPYEVTCAISRRVPRVYINQDSD
jgi:alanine racemase